jgi:hypothetical protein
MRIYEVPGLFSGNIKIYYYPSIKPSKKVFLVLKGIYGEHIPGGTSWDNALVKLLENDYHLIFIRTSRLNEKMDREAFVGKTFKQECDEVINAFEYCNKNIFSNDYVWGCVGVSFGGTIFLGSPEVFSQMKIAIMVGSGCGRNPETTKPLLSTLPETKQLLKSLDNFRGVFIFLHGDADIVVPTTSQQMIYDRAIKNAIKHEWNSLPNLDHSLRDTITRESHMAEIVSSRVRENFS